MTEALIEPELAHAVVTRGRSADRDEVFARLYERWHPALLAYVRRHFGPRDAEEITQETLARAYELLDLSRETRRQWGWLIVVARNIAADMGRHRKLCDVTETDLVYAQDDPHDVEQPLLDEEGTDPIGCPHFTWQNIIKEEPEVPVCVVDVPESRHGKHMPIDHAEEVA